MKTLMEPQRLREMRERRRLSQQQLAERAGLDKQTVHRWEKGKRRPVRPATLEALATALGTAPDVLSGTRLPDEPTEKELRAHGVHQLNVRVRGHVRNAYTLVSQRYGVPTSRIVDIAPFLFAVVAEQSLERRRNRIADLKTKLAEVDELRGNFSHLPVTVAPGYRAEDAIAAEESSVSANDILGSSIPVSLFDDAARVASNYDEAEDGPFVRFLSDLASALPHKMSFRTFQSNWGVEFEVCRDDAMRLAGGDETLAGEILCGSIALYEMPRELFASDATEQRVAWLAAKLNEPSWMDDIFETDGEADD